MDLNINFEWEKYPSKNAMSWEEALEYAFSLHFDWRIPTKEELFFAYKNKIEGFQDVEYWSSSNIPEKYKYKFPKTYCTVRMNNGFINYKRNVDLYHVRCIRNI